MSDAARDMSLVHLCDPVTGKFLTRLYPLDKAPNADGARTAKPSPTQAPTAPLASGMAQILR